MTTKKPRLGRGLDALLGSALGAYLVHFINPDAFRTLVGIVILGVGALVGQRQERCRLTLAEVVTHVLAQRFGAALVIQQIVHQLEGGAQRSPVGGAGFFHLWR